MAISKKPYKGTRDFFPKDKRVMDHMFSVMKKTARSFGYEPYDGPMLEEVELYKAKSGEELINEQIYSFNDRGDRFVAIRPEMTPTVARMVAQVHKEVAKPIRWFSIPNLYRYERPQKGRLREHWQFNVDIFGAPGRLGEVEIIDLAVSLMKNYGADESMFEIQLNDRAIVNLVFEKLMMLNAETTYKLYKIVDKSKKVSKEALDKMIGEINLSDEQITIFKNYLSLNSFDKVYDFLKSNNASEELESMQGFYESAKALGLDAFVTYDPAIVRGLDYYTGIVFEIFDKHPDNKRAICGGGAYANLLKIFNEDPMAGVGFGLGDVTLRDFLETHGLLPKELETNTVDLYLATESTDDIANILSCASGLRTEKFAKVLTELSAIKFKKMFKLAEKNGARFIGIIQGDAIEVKNMQTKEANKFKITDTKEIINILRS